jgi:uncharacterized protein involved in type VI secretion and phage assembly
MSITDLLAPKVTPHHGGPGSFVLGTVAENNGKDFPGMVKVAFTAWTEGENISKWLPVLSPYAGKGYGCYLIPEVGDIVLVGFIGPMLEQPFVLGSFYPADTGFKGEQFDEGNFNRSLKTKGGVSLTVKDEGGKQSIHAETPKGFSITIDDGEESIVITDKKNCVKLDAKGEALELTAGKKITLKAGSCEISMDGTEGALTVKGGQLKLEGSQTVNLKSGNMLTAEGGMTTVEGKQTLTLKGSAMCEVSGGMVKIN